MIVANITYQVNNLSVYVILIIKHIPLRTLILPEYSITQILPVALKIRRGYPVRHKRQRTFYIHNQLPDRLHSRLFKAKIFLFKKNILQLLKIQSDFR